MQVVEDAKEQLKSCAKILNNPVKQNSEDGQKECVHAVLELYKAIDAVEFVQRERIAVSQSCLSKVLAVSISVGGVCFGIDGVQHWADSSAALRVAHENIQDVIIDPASQKFRLRLRSRALSAMPRMSPFLVEIGVFAPASSLIRMTSNASASIMERLWLAPTLTISCQMQ